MKRVFYIVGLLIFQALATFSTLEIVARWWIASNDLDNHRVLTDRPWYTPEFIYEQHRFNLSSYVNIDGSMGMYDQSGTYFNVVDGLRVTSSQPRRYKHTTWMFGSSTLAGWAVPDAATIPSYLQQLTSNRVVNLARVGSTIYSAENQLLSIDIQPGDTVIYLYGYIESMALYDLSRETTFCSVTMPYWDTSFCYVYQSQFYLAPQLLDRTWVASQLDNLRTRVQATIKHAKKVVLAHRATFVFVLQPQVWHDALNKRALLLNASIQYSVEHSWYIFQEVADCDLSILGGNDLAVFVDSVHLNDTGNHLVALKIRECINPIV